LVTRCRVLSDSGLRGFDAGSSVIQPNGEFEWSNSGVVTLGQTRLARLQPSRGYSIF